MWKNGAVLTGAWKACVQDHIRARAGSLVNQWDGLPNAMAVFQAQPFMPNIVMLDFADPGRCAQIWNLNIKHADRMNAMGGDLRGVAGLPA
ncbi:MAG: hypothetical protein ACI87W_001591 [Halieaceae bacterium]|jgi:hypothetical protein